MDTKEVKKIVKLCRELGVLSLKQGDFEITLSPQALFPLRPTKDTQPQDQQLTSEEILMWSSAGIPDA